MRSTFVFAFLFATANAFAYDQPVHVFLSKRVYAGPAAFNDSAATAQAAVDKLRLRLYRAGVEAPNDLKRRFLARFPTVESFDSAAFKRLFMLNPQKAVVGFDDTPLPTGGPLDVYGLASRLVDDDQRNRDRIRLASDGKPQLDAWGREVPTDPATLDMGARLGLSSQAHAHYQLPKLNFSEDAEVLKGEPRRFAKPADTHTFGAEFADAYTTLALLAAQEPQGMRLALVHAGAAAHHIEDVANQIHTVQVGIYDFFFDAKIESIKEELRSVGGLLRPRLAFVPIGLQIISNHHVLLEDLFAKHLLATGDPIADEATRPHPDAPYALELARLPKGCSVPFGRTLTETLVERSSLEGPAAYTAIHTVALSSLSKAGQRFDETDDPDKFIRPGADLRELYAIELRGVERSDMTLRAWWERFNACMKLPASVEKSLAERLLKTRLDSLDAVDARVAAWRAPPPETLDVNWWVPGGYSGALLFVLLLIRSRRRRVTSSQKKPSAPSPTSSPPSA